MRYKKLSLILIFICLISMLNPMKVYADKGEDLDKKKVIYLTFDDGPSEKVTNRILDTLKENNIKATFFVVGKEIEHREHVLKRIHDEGHSIGLHTYSHNFHTIYKSDDIFIEEMQKTSDKIKSITGVESKIIRFPGGSKKHLNNEMLEKLHKCNFKIYDWNRHMSDGIDYTISSYRLYREATKGIEEKDTIILLMHCGSLNRNTCSALPKVIEFYKKKGYEFKPIKQDTPEFYFKIYKPKFKASFFNK